MVLPPYSLQTFCGSHNSYYSSSFFFTVVSSPSTHAVITTCSSNNRVIRSSSKSVFCILFIFNVSQAVQNQALWADEPCFYSTVWGWPAINRSVGQSRSFHFYPVTYVIPRHIKVWEITTPPHRPLNSVGYRKGTY